VNQTIRIGNAQGFWGDRPSAATDLLTQEPQLDFLTMDYLAEVSMSILATQRERNPALGYAQDFVAVVAGLADYWGSGGRCRLIANAGGLNPLACAQACAAALEKAGCRSLRIGVVSGDDVLDWLLQPSSPVAPLMGSQRQPGLESVRSRLVTANAYLGCRGIVRALDAGADLVITGRVADPSMVVGACVHAFGWSLDDWPRLAQATVAGHLLECGTQLTGGIATDWLEMPGLVDIGFPIAEIDAQGGCVVTKPKASGGRVSLETVKEQLLYEIGDPANYLSPDVCVSLLGLQLEQLAEDRVAVRGARGGPPPATLKVSATYRDGFRSAAQLTIFGIEARHKAQLCGELVLQRLRRNGWQYRDQLVECLGSGASVPCGQPPPAPDLAPDLGAVQEVVLRVAVESHSQAAVEAFTREIMPMVTAGPPGTTGYAEGRPRVHTLFRYWPGLIGADCIVDQLQWLTSPNTLDQRTLPPGWPPQADAAADRPPNAAAGRPPDAVSLPAEPPPPPSLQRPRTGRLIDVAYGRSGDKGTGSNIGIIARRPQEYPQLRAWLTAQRVADFLAPLEPDRVQRFEVPNLHGLNFVLDGVLRRGLRSDAQGKALAQALLSMPLDDFPGLA
jgi:hypothetical protein